MSIATAKLAPLFLILRTLLLLVNWKLSLSSFYDVVCSIFVATNLVSDESLH